MNSYTEIAGIDWSRNRMIPAFSAPQHLNIYDIRGASRDIQLSITTLTGLINRPQPQIYLITGDDDIFWLKEALTSIPQDTAPITNNDVLPALLNTYHTAAQGFIIYDPNFIDSINIATTLAGQLNGIVASPNLAETLSQNTKRLPLLADLRTYKWKNRLQAYHWAKDNLLKGASPHLIAGLDPRIVTGLRSFLVATRTFVYWLDPRSILPDPSSGWRSERCLMKDILSAFSSKALHLGWFINEPGGVNLTSRAAIPVLASDYFINLETWTSIQPETSHPLQASEEQTGSMVPGMLNKQTDTTPGGEQTISALTSYDNTAAGEETAKVYVSFTMSDGDNLQYNQHRMSRLWRDPARGSLPIGWTTSLLLLQAAPRMAVYYANTATSNDELIAGPSGAGYMFPSAWPESALPAFLQRTGQLMQDLKVNVLQILDANILQRIGLYIPSGMALSNHNLQKQFVETLLPFGIHGILSGSGRTISSSTTISNIPIYQNLGLAGSVSRAVKLIKNAASANQQRPLYLNVYTLAWKMGPSELKQVVQQLGNEYQVVTPGRLLEMLAAARKPTSNKM